MSTLYLQWTLLNLADAINPDDEIDPAAKDILGWGDTAAGKGGFVPGKKADYFKPMDMPPLDPVDKDPKDYLPAPTSNPLTEPRRQRAYLENIFPRGRKESPADWRKRVDKLPATYPRAQKEEHSRWADRVKRQETSRIAREGRAKAQQKKLAQQKTPEELATWNQAEKSNPRQPGERYRHWQSRIKTTLAGKKQRRGYGKNDLNLYPGRDIGQSGMVPSVNVKAYYHPSTEDVAEHFGVSPDNKQLQRAMEWVWNGNQEQFWEQAQMDAELIFGSDVEVSSGGRGGHLLVRGLKDHEDWNAADYAKWRKFEKWMEGAVPTTRGKYGKEWIDSAIETIEANDWMGKDLADDDDDDDWEENDDE